ncbi:MAG: hypothetical protein K6F84_06520 [Lachnospiraceae bacterium]|nr:hypothetical protein [Lachnospiraceae bacterium]
MRDGKLPENEYCRSVVRQIKNKTDNILKGASYGEDCAFFAEIKGNIISVFAGGTTEFVPVENYFYEAAAKILSKKGRLIGFNVFLILPGDRDESFLKEIVKKADETAGKLNSAIASFKVTSDKNLGVVTVFVDALGEVINYNKSGVLLEEEDSLILSRHIGLEGTSILGTLKEKELKDYYPSYFVEEGMGFNRYLNVSKDIEEAFNAGCNVVYPLGEGGILGGLREFGIAFDTGFEINLRSIPVRQETVEITDRLDVNPYELRSGGCLILSAKDGEEVVETLGEKNIPAAVIGHITKDKKRILLNEGVVRYLDRAAVDSLYTIK